MSQGGRARIGGVVFVLAMVLVPASASATDFPVTNANDTGAGSLRQAITDANGNSGPDSITINIANPPNTLTLGSALPAISDDVTITGPGQSQFTVNGADLYQPFRVNSGIVSISDLTVEHGLCDQACGHNGGGILNAATLTLNDVTVSSNVTTGNAPNLFSNGGGIYNTGTLTLDGGTVSSNTAQASGGTNMNASGGGIYNTGSLTLNGTTVSNNSAAGSGGSNSEGHGGGIWSSGPVSLTLSTVGGNNASGSGSSGQNAASSGGIEASFGASLSLDRSSVNSNTASASGGTTRAASGGGIFSTEDLTVLRSTVSGNTASTVGTGGAAAGGIGTVNPADPSTIQVTIDRSTITDNTASEASGNNSQSGGIDLNAGDYTITSSTIAHNSAFSGGNVLVRGTPTFKNTIVSNAGSGGDCGGLAGIVSGGYNIDSDGTCGFSEPTDQPNTDPMLAAALADNGGPTQTYALQTGSPAIDQGLSSAGETVDQRGEARPSDFSSIANGAGGDGTDIGAFEVKETDPPDTIIDSGPSGNTNDPTPTFAFHSTEAGSTFQCRVDSAAFAGCTSPRTLAHLDDGPHTFFVRARDAAMNLDLTPASRSFTVKTAAISRSGSTLLITAAPGAKDNFRISSPSASTIQISDAPSSPYTGSGVHTVSGSGCTRTNDYVASCNAAGVGAVKVTSGAQTDKVTNLTGVPSTLIGGAAADVLTGGSADDTLNGGTGADSFKGMNGNDTLLARDNASDVLINCEGSYSPNPADKAILDALPKDPDSIVHGCETKVRP